CKGYGRWTRRSTRCCAKWNAFAPERQSWRAAARRDNVKEREMKMLCLDQPLPGATMENYKPARIVIFLSVALLLSAPLHAQRMEISSNGSRASVRGAAETFTGTVFVESLFAA